MDETSVLETRFQNETEEQHSPTEEKPPADEASRLRQEKVDVAESFLMFVSSAMNSEVAPAQRLEAMRQCHTLGEGASFTVKRHFRSQRTPFVGQPKSPDQIIKVSRQTYSPGYEQTFKKTAFSALMKELHALQHPDLRRHPNVVSIRAVGWAISAAEPLELCPSLFLDKAPHRTLLDLEKSGVDLDVPSRRQLCLDVALGIKALHSSHIVHGDVKAENLLIFDRPEGGYLAKISDFGCAVFLEKYGSSDPQACVRLPGISQPWCAPEALNPVPVDELVFTDVYSLGLLIFRLMVFCNPFDIFDLPPDKEIRLQCLSNLLSLKHFPLLIPTFVEDWTCARWTRGERMTVTKLFAKALATAPRERDLTLITRLLKLLLNRPPSVSEVVECMQATTSSEAGPESDISTTRDGLDTANPGGAQATAKPSPAKGPPETLPVLDICRKETMLLPLQVRRQIQSFLQVLHEHILEMGRSNTCSYDQDIRDSIHWNLFNFYLLGRGAYQPDLKAAMKVLYWAGTDEGGKFSKSWSLMLLLQKVEPVFYTDEQKQKILYWTARARATQGLTQRLMGKCFGEDFHNAVDSISLHSVTEDKMELFEATRKAPADERALFAEPALRQRTDFSGGNRFVHLAAIFGDLELVKLALKHDPTDIDVTNHWTETPLLLACHYGRLDVVEYLLEQGADATIGSGDQYSGENPLYWLSSFPEEQRLELARKLLTAGAHLQHIFFEHERDVELFSQDEFLFRGRVVRSPLLRAIGNGDLVATKALVQLIREQFEPDQQAIPLRYCFLQPMRLAALFHYHEILEFLCSQLEEIMKGMVGDDPCENALVVWWVQIVKSNAVACDALGMAHHVERLCIHGEEWEFACHQTLSVLIKYGLLRPRVMIATPRGRPVLVDTLQACISEYSNITALKYLVQYEEFRSCINKVDEQFTAATAIDAALDFTNLTAFRILVDAGAELDLGPNPNPKHRLSDEQANYLHVCASNQLDELEFARRILDAGVPVGACNRSGVSNLTMAVMKSAFGLARLLIERGASVNTPGSYDYTILGFILEPVIATQVVDLPAAVRFLLSLTGEDAASFVVRDESGATALHLAANCFAPDEAHIEALKLLLQQFSSPEHINAKAKVEPFSTPLQVAIANHNLVAVKLLVKAGADIYEKDHHDEDAMDLAVSSIHKLIVKKSNLARKDIEDDVSRALEIISFIAAEGSWPSQFDIGERVWKILEAAGFLISDMKKIPHWRRQQLGLDGILSRIIDQHIMNIEYGPDPVRSLAKLNELRRQLDQALRPIFFSEMVFEVGIVEESSDKRTPQRDLRPRAKARMPILNDLTIKAFDALQQSAAFEFALEQIRSGIEFPSIHDVNEDDSDTARLYLWSRFQRFAERREQLEFPYDGRFTRYPQSLHSWYEDPRNYRQLHLRNEEEKEMIESFKQALRLREEELKEGKATLTPFDDEFRTFHFIDLQAGATLSLARMTGDMRILCRCICMKYGNELGDIKMEKVIYLDFETERRLDSFSQAMSGLLPDAVIVEAAVRSAYRDFESVLDPSAPMEDGPEDADAVFPVETQEAGESALSLTSSSSLEAGLDRLSIAS